MQNKYQNWPVNDNALAPIIELKPITPPPESEPDDSRSACLIIDLHSIDNYIIKNIPEPPNAA